MTDGIILERLDALIIVGEKVLGTRKSPGSYVIGHDIVESALFQQWHTNSVAFLKAVFGDNGVHYREYEERCKDSYYYHAERGVAILRAAKEDIAGGYLQKVENLVSAEIFHDFLEIAQHLLDNNYKDPAASLIGAVLEDGLRRICNDTIPVKTSDNISSLNQKLADKKVYNRLQQQEIEVWNKIRDYADHGHFGEYNIERVTEMLAGVRNFLANYLK